jgi:multiple sugar transport system permease protein
MVWFASADLAFWAVVISITWKVVGFGMVLFIAAIQSIDREILEAAVIDGAGYWKRVFLIIVPLSRRIILLATLVSAIGSMLAFDQFYIMTSGGPRGQTFTAVYWIYQNSFVSFRLGYGAALSIVLTLIIFVFSTLQIGLTARSEPGRLALCLRRRPIRRPRRGARSRPRRTASLRSRSW